MKALWSLCLVALLPLAAFSVAPAPRAVASECQSQSDEIPSAIPGTPVVYVHGWIGSGPDSADAQSVLISSLGSKYPVFGFDYGAENTTWAADPTISGCLASYIERAAAASKAGGGSGKVIAVAHSMGGIAVRAASGSLASDSHYADLAGLVTMGTPHMGSPLAGDFATIGEWAKRLSLIPVPFPKPGSAASDCLAWPRPANCAGVPYLAYGEKIATIAGQINVKASLFDLQVFPSRTYDIGDSVVLRSSANGYPGSSLGPTPPGTLLGAETVSCTVSSGQINRQLFAPGGFGPLGANASTLASTEKGEGSLEMAAEAVAVQNMKVPCAHGQLPTNHDVVALVSRYVRSMVPNPTVPKDQPTASQSPTQSGGDGGSDTLGSGSSPSATGPKWFSLTDDVTREITYQGGQYDVRTATIRTTTYPKSEVYRYQQHLPSDMHQNWIDYALNGKCTAFEAGVGISTLAVSPTSSATFTVFVDGAQKAQVSLGYYDEPQNLHIDITGASRLRIQLDFPGYNSTAAVWGTPRIFCSSNPSPS